MVICYNSHRKLTQVWRERWSWADIGKTCVCARLCVRVCMEGVATASTVAMEDLPEKVTWGTDLHVVLGWRNVPERENGDKTLRHVLAQHVREMRPSCELKRVLETVMGQAVQQWTYNSVFNPRLTDTVLAAARPAVMTLAKQHRSTPIPKQPVRHLYSRANFFFHFHWTRTPVLRTAVTTHRRTQEIMT